MIKKKKVMLVFGTRPEAIKMAPLCHALRREHEAFETIVCVTAQHRQMLDQTLRVFDIVPDIDLDLMTPGQDLFDVTSAVLLGMREVLMTNRPDMLLVHGDTTTALAASMAAYYAGVPVSHVEAGLRTHDLQAPFPEEFNRRVVGKLARWHFAPTAASKQNLLDERVKESSISITGNTVIDALNWVLDRIEEDGSRRLQLDAMLNSCLGFAWTHARFLLITGHRRENFGDGFLQICEALKELATLHPDVHFVYPVHLNPQVQGPVNRALTGQCCELKPAELESKP